MPSLPTPPLRIHRLDAAALRAGDLLWYDFLVLLFFIGDIEYGARFLPRATFVSDFFLFFFFRWDILRAARVFLRGVVGLYAGDALPCAPALPRGDLLAIVFRGAGGLFASCCFDGVVSFAVVFALGISASCWKGGSIADRGISFQIVSFRSFATFFIARSGFLWI